MLKTHGLNKTLERTFIHRIAKAFLKIIIPLSLILPISMLYILDPSSFLIFWQARGPYILFIGLFCLEFALAWGKLGDERALNRVRSLSILLVAIVPAAYVLATQLFGFSDAITELGKFVGVPYITFGKWFIDVSWPITLEYATLAASFTAMIILAYTKDGLKKFVVTLFFIWANTFFLGLNTFAPYGIVWALQVFVPVTTVLTSRILELLGFQTIVTGVVSGQGPGMLLTVIDGTSSFSALVYWPSAGIHSLFLYTIVILLFLRSISFSFVSKIVCFVVGALGTFVANILRIVTISIIGLRTGLIQATIFHDYFGELFFISWMLIYLLSLIFGSDIVRRFRSSLAAVKHLLQKAYAPSRP